MDNKENKGPQDAKLINIHEAYEVSYWTKALNVSKEQLETAVQSVGTSAEKVKSYLSDLKGHEL